MERYKLEIVNDHGDRYIRCEPAPDGSWVMFKDVAELQNKGCARDQTTTQYCAEVIERDKRIAELEAALGGLTAWVAEWTDHVGDCSHKNETCTCGRAFNLHKARAALKGEKGDLINKNERDQHKTK